MSEQLYQVCCREYVYDRFDHYPKHAIPYRVDTYSMGPPMDVSEATHYLRSLKIDDVFSELKPIFCDYWLKPV